MAELTVENASIGITYEDTLPLSFKALSMEPTDAEKARMHTDNEQVLHIIAALDEMPTEYSGDEPEAETELQRLNFKVNVALDLISFLIKQQVNLPVAVQMRLSSESIKFQNDGALKCHDLTKVEVYLSDKYPRPLFFLGRVEEVEVDAEKTKVIVRFLPIGGTFRDHLEKFIFRKHRRLIAFARQNR